MKMQTLLLVSLAIQIALVLAPKESMANEIKYSETYEVSSYPEYFRKFHFKPLSCYKGERYYEFIMDYTYIPVEGTNQVVTLKIYLFEDKYIAEVGLLKPAPLLGPNTYSYIDKREIEGSSRVVRDSLVLDGLGTGVPVVHEGKDLIQFQLDNLEIGGKTVNSSEVLARFMSTSIRKEFSVPCE